MIKSKISLLVLALTAINSQAFAGTTTGNFQSAATLNSTCSVVVNDLPFGVFSPAPGFISGNTTVVATCTNNTPFTISLLAGGVRTLKGTKSGNTDTLTYALYTDAALTKIFGDGTSGSYTLNGNGGTANLSIYGRLITSKYATPDDYKDSVTINLTY